MYIARIIYPIEVLGPGKRIGLWFSGCPHHCMGCSNPELWKQQPEQKITMKRLLEIVNAIADAHPVDGFTITGGEPFAQAAALVELIKNLSTISTDILVYSGYTKAELEVSGDVDVQDALGRIAVLIDGRYEEARNNGALLRGSDNQVIHKLNPQWKVRYDTYIENAVNQIQNFTVGDSVISVGIHNPGFSETLDRKVIEKGILP